MGDEYEIVDRYGRPTGERARRVGSGDNCFSGLIVIGIVIFLLIAGVLWLCNFAGIATGIVKPTPTPIPYMDTTISATNATRTGNFEGHIPGFSGSSDEHPNGMRSGATLTFTGINAPIDGTYSISFSMEYCYARNNSYTLDIIVNRQKQATLAISDAINYGSAKINLHKGGNTIQLQLNGNDVYADNPVTFEPKSVPSCIDLLKIEVQGNGSNQS